MGKTVKVGQTILATDENRKLTVNQVIKNQSGVGFTFSGLYVDPAGVDRNGEFVYGARGFRHDSGNWEVVN